MSDVEVRVDEAALREFLSGVNGPVVRELNRLARKVRDAAKRLAPPHVRGGIEVRATTRGPDGPEVTIASTATGPNGEPLGLWAEVGTRPHIIRSTGPWPLRNRETGQVFGPVVHHPGTKATPHLRPALLEVLFSDR